ncbi:MADS BOX PROTEIN [Salix koriyanagi]|uniref:MADS BOX PROTEIN n=1 Tax=Salix koriyanagi TaxID=2511006 RepID=A0A9Q0WWT7_9ROSI|nr:MADS BOX PROTEIN [Salix koriyanagi]
MTTLRGNGAKPMKNKSYEERKQTLKKKASELATLCDVPVCLVCVNPDGTTETWPGNESEEDEKGKEKVVDKAPEVFETWDTRLEYLPEESLVDVLKILDRQLQAVNRAVGKEQQTGKKRKSLQDEGRSKIVHGVNDDGSQKAGLIRNFFIDSAGLNLTNSCTGNYSDINSFSG